MGLYTNFKLNKLKNGCNRGVWGLLHFYVNADTADLCQHLPAKNFKGIPSRQTVYSRVVEVPP